ncbi:hypothetical protein MMC11_007256 [Xylographa trunciseda]|nr:hypothetical protein [Xylographa trunciseda]
MASRIKKLLHRKDDDANHPPQSPVSPPRVRRSKEGTRDPGLRQSLYDEAMPGHEPVMGTYPQGGNNMSGQRSSPIPRGNDASDGTNYASSSQSGALTSDFSKLNLDGGRDATIRPVPSEAIPTRGRPVSDEDEEDEYNANVIGNSRRSNHEPLYTTPSSLRGNAIPENRRRFQGEAISTTPTVANVQQQEEQGLSRKRSIPRKSVGSGSTSQASEPVVSSSPNAKFHSRQSSLQKPLPTAPYGSQGLGASELQNTSGKGQVNDLSQGTGLSNTAQDVVSRAMGNTRDTEVIETIAPAIVHETVKKDIHYVKHEVVTRDIHEHTYYHRILPVIDVEVLPPRHFLPVEGGGLVEVSADEVPGRGKNWVIAETASKIPSAGPLPDGPRKFTARQFVGTEGDDKTYTMPEGYERTEQTWVHPPELETLGQASGQTWPMEFGQDPSIRTPGKQSHRSPSKSGKQKGVLKQSTSGQDLEERTNASTGHQQSSTTRLSEQPIVAGFGATSMDPRSIQ